MLDRMHRRTPRAAMRDTGPGAWRAAPAWSGAAYAAGAVVTADCQVSTVGTACYNQVGKRFAWRCDNAGWCQALRPGSNQGGWWSAWTSLEQCN
jgi:hypothetical protein